MKPLAPAASIGARVPPARTRAELSRLAQQLEGVFLNQLFHAMRATIPQDGALGQAPGQDLFTQLFDERMADQAARHLSPGLTNALVRQLVSRIPNPDPTEEK